MNLQTFEELLSQLKKAKANRRLEAKKHAKELDQEAHEIWRSYFNNKKFNWKAFDELPEAEAYNEKAKAAARKFHARHNEIEANLESQLELAAEQIEIPKSVNLLRWKTSYFRTYSSQGVAAVAHTERAAKLHEDKATANNLKTEIRKTEESFEVWVGATEIGLKVLSYKPEDDLVEQVRRIYKRGGNPRVFFPFLRSCFEERNGLDKFGNKK